jgi:hypothetical protein
MRQAGARPALFAVLGPLLFSGCVQSATDPGDLGALVELSFEGLQPLDPGLKYQVWAVTERSGVFQGLPFLLFDVDEEGRMVDPVQDTLLAGPFLLTLPVDEVYAIAVSLELSQGEFSSASASYLLGGILEGRTADLELSPWVALNMDLSQMGGRYVLGTPTAANGEDGVAGIWFMDGSGAAAVPGLDLPGAVPGWLYEGWVVVGADTLSTGKFSAASGQDLSDSFCGEGPVPEYPGEDFLVDPPHGVAFPLHLPGARVLITLEPWGTWDLEPASPFFLHLLEAEIPESAAAGEVREMTSLFSLLPRGTARVRKP